MDATAPAGVSINPRPLINLVDAPRDPFAQNDEGRYYVFTGQCLLAQREAERGEFGNARALISNKCYPQANAIFDFGTRTQALSDVSQLISYVDSLAPQADQLQGAATISDATYTKSQVLTAAQLTSERQDNADTQAVMDGNMSAAQYGLKPVERAVAKASGDALGAVGGLGASLLGPWKWWLLGIGVVVIGSMAAYFYVGRKAMGTVSS